MARRFSKKRLKAGLKVIADTLKPHRREVSVLIFLSVVEALGNASVPYLAGSIIDGITSQKTIAVWGYALPLFLLLPIIWFAVKVVTDTVSNQGNTLNEKLGGDVEAEYLVRGFGKILEFPLSVHKSIKTGEMTNRISRASGYVSTIITDILVRLAPQFLSIVAAFFFTFLIKPALTLILFGAVILYVFILIKGAPRIAELILKVNRAYNKAWGEAHDAILNVQAVKQAVAEEYEKKKFHRSFYLKAANFWSRYIALSQSINLAQKLLVSLTQLVIFIFSIYLIRAGQMTVGELVAFNGYAALLFGPFVVLVQNWQAIQNGLITIERAEKLLGKGSENYKTGEEKEFEIKGRVEFKNVSFAYGRSQRLILKDVSFTAAPGEVIALVGESGVGKSTLVDLISRYYKPTKGMVRVDGQSVSKIPLRELRRQIAMVPQEVILFHDTVQNNIRYGNFTARDDEVTLAAKEAYAHDFIERFAKKYEQVVGERGIKLSVGQKQRLAIARAILKNPKILILDEPTSALDARSEKLVTEALEKLMARRTTFIIAHRLSTVRKADKILVIEKGEIRETGRHEELIKIPNGIYRRLYEYQIGLK
ncbi:MAG: ABC transporter ATP-binding protein [bacterium]|nr:ABC transporter ATP-binding protein [bacterium]